MQRPQRISHPELTGSLPKRITAATDRAFVEAEQEGGDHSHFASLAGRRVS